MRRRPFRPRRPIRNPQIRARRTAPPKLKEANRLFAVGEYREAGKLFKEVAEKALQRQIPQAPTLFIKSGAAFLKEGDIENGENIIFKGFELFIQRNRIGFVWLRHY